MYTKTKHKGRKHFCMACLPNFTTKEILNKHREQCLLINNTQAVTCETGIIKFRNLIIENLYQLKFVLILNVH